MYTDLALLWTAVAVSRNPVVNVTYAFSAYVGLALS